MAVVTKPALISIRDEFRNPPAFWRGKPFWSWNGDLDETELHRQLETIDRMGFGGAFLHSRTGLKTEYLGAEWFRLVRSCSIKASELGLEAWVYDEDRWPSGTAGGLVTANPEYRSRYLFGMYVQDTTRVPDPGHLRTNMLPESLREPSHPNEVNELWICSCPKRGKIAYRRARTGEGIPADARLFAVFDVRMPPNSFYNGFTYLDTMNPDATQAFLYATHERYHEAIGDLFGTAVRGVFTDEPHRGVVFDGFNLQHAPLSDWYIPYTEGLFQRFQADYGYDLKDHLPALFFRSAEQPVCGHIWRYMDLLQKLFLEGFAVPYQNWCAEHRLPLTGHVLHEDSLTAQSVMCGSVMRYYEHMDIPGIDILGEHNRSYQVAKQLQSVMRQTGKRYGLSELYGCSGWQISFEGFKWSGDWQALLGINVRCPHLSWYTMEGEAKRDFPTSILHQSGWWTEYARVETYFARFGRFMAEGTPRCRLLVVNPVESVWCRLYQGATTMLHPNDPGLMELEQEYTRLVEMLLEAGIDFDLGDEEMLARLGSVDVERQTVRLGECTYYAVLVPHCTSLRSSTLERLEDFAQAGGAVAFWREPPEYVDAELSTRALRLAEELPVQRGRQQSDMTSWAARHGLQSIAFLGQDNEPVSGLMAQVHDLDDKGISVVAINTDRSKPCDYVELRVPAETERVYTVQEWDFLTGAVLDRGTIRSDGQVSMLVSIAAAGSRAWALSPAEHQPTEHQSEAAAVSSSSPDFRAPRRRKIGLLPQPDSYVLSEPNICVLDRARYRIESGEWSDATDILRVDRTVRESLGWEPRHGEMVQPWYRDAQGVHVSDPGSVELEFRFYVTDLPLGRIDLALERIGDVRAVRLNGCAVNGAVDAWIDRCFSRIELPRDALAIGENTIALQIDYTEDSGLEAVYLLGGFGVRLDGTMPCVETLPSSLSFGSIHTQGFPFYSGAVTYHWNKSRLAPGIDLDAETELVVRCDSFEGATLRVDSGERSHAVPFPPYEAPVDPDRDLEITVILTRRNTFGPLHHVPNSLPAYGPPHWQSRDEHWSDGYQLWDGGVLQAPWLGL